MLAFGAYLIAERLHVSGVLAVVAAGLVVGSFGPRGMSPTTRIVLFNFWEYVAFLANSLVFILIGLQVSIPLLITYWQPVLAAIAGGVGQRAQSSPMALAGSATGSAAVSASQSPCAGCTC